jgi:signal transduction histidine kinase
LFARLDLSALATELAESYAPAVADGRQSLEWSIVPNLATYGDRELIAQAIVNLLDNARRHTPEGTAIQLALQPSGDRIRLSVADDGPGVPKADRERIVRRFARLDESRTTPGHGLGLNLVAAVARLHDTELVLNDNAPGLIAMLDFPMAADAEVFAP